MAGYFDFSKSNNAVIAENEGLMVASDLAKKLKRFLKGIDATIVNDVIPEREWHHTSKFYNQCNYYSYDDALEYLSELKNRQKIRKAISIKVEIKTKIKKDNCLGLHNISWLEWGGTRSHPRAEERTVLTKLYQQTEKSFYFFVDGIKIIKRQSTNGFYFRKIEEAK